MTRVNNIIPPTTTSASTAANSMKGNGLNDIDLTDFLTLMLTELQNQDPLNPTDNAALLQQVGELRGISSNDQLVSTLKGFSNTQELTTASSLIGKTVKGLDNAAKEVTGAVTSVSVKIDEKDRNKREVQVHVGDQIVDIKNVREIDNKAVPPA
ncbi:MAG TPA: flagellar hook capping FlgD N-terminal domain-containing protein [Pirellula sp.]|nr:flagellar hook capping FlgD N-terminal domain-containing protein [Pirellula sp.]